MQTVPKRGGAGTDQSTFHFHETRLTGLQWAETRMETHLGDLNADPIQGFEDRGSGLPLDRFPVHHNLDHRTGTEIR